MIALGQKIRTFPIMDGPTVPWEVMAPHESAAQKNHYQSLEKLASRGGLSPGEAWCVVQNIPCPHDKPTWDSYTEKWKEFAERINLHFDRLEKYNELIMAVGTKFPNETRHQTALRYIQEADHNSISGPSQEQKQ
jgi:hypothetical protein